MSETMRRATKGNGNPQWFPRGPQLCGGESRDSERCDVGHPLDWIDGSRPEREKIRVLDVLGQPAEQLKSRDCVVASRGRDGRAHLCSNDNGSLNVTGIVI